jgi:hypothetical protein
MFFRTIALLILVVFTATVAVTQKTLAHSSVFSQPNISIDQRLPQDNIAKNLTESERLDELNSSELAEVSPVQPIAIAKAENHVGRPLTVDDRENIKKILGENNIIPTSKFSPLGNPRVILHDTAYDMGCDKNDECESLNNHKNKTNRGPLGNGVSAWIRVKKDAVIARPNFYEKRRPTTTHFEKVADQDQFSLEKRKKMFRDIWKSTTENSKKKSLNQALIGLGLEEWEIKKEQAEAKEQLDGSVEKRDENTGKVTTANIFTTATWAVEKICDENRISGGTSVALPGQMETLKANCIKADNYFMERNQRISNSVPIEILQVGLKNEKTAISAQKTTCAVPTINNPNLEPFTDPPYSKNQYNNVVLQYLHAALIAGKYPELTTHFALDKSIKGEEKNDAHCDPRCFNMNKLYEMIANKMEHPVGTTYGIKPSYGDPKSGSHNVWWEERFCHGKPPV